MDHHPHGDCVFSQHGCHGILFGACDAGSEEPAQTEPAGREAAEQQVCEGSPVQPGGFPTLLHPLPCNGAHILPGQKQGCGQERHNAPQRYGSHHCLYEQCELSDGWDLLLPHSEGESSLNTAGEAEAINQREYRKTCRKASVDIQKQRNFK